MNPGAVGNWNVFDWTIVFPARSRALVSTTTKYIVPEWRPRVGRNVTRRESALHWKEPSAAGEIENACSTEARSIPSVNVIRIHGVVFVSGPTGRTSVTDGGVMSIMVQVSFPAGAGSTLPARSVAIDRNATTPCPPAVKVPVVAGVPTSPFVHPPPTSYWIVYVAMSLG